jgi:hypothetical protein
LKQISLLKIKQSLIKLEVKLRKPTPAVEQFRKQRKLESVIRNAK